MKKYVIKLNGKVYEVEMEEVTGETSVAYEKISAASQNNLQQTSVPQSVVPESNAAQSSGSQNTEGEILDAPMPGNIINVAVKVGDTVKKGQLIIILEAMKMENEIVSPKDGIITLVAVSKGQSVNAGDALVKIS